MTTTFSLRGELGLGAKPTTNPQRQRFETYGILDNPFPPANKTAGNPRSTNDIDKEIANHIKAFLNSKTSEVVVVTGTQGLGKTNLLEFYQREMSDILQEEGNSYVVRYYTDPQSDFSSVVSRIFQELGDEHFKHLARATRDMSHEQKSAALALVSTPDLRVALSRLFRHQDEDTKLAELAKLLLEFLMGLRLYKKHSDELGLQQRLDTTESKTQALHDVIYISQHLGVLNGLFLFLDELEKAGAFTSQGTTRYLSAIRALMDVLPQHMFLMLAMTPEAHARYARDLPALGGRLQDVLKLEPLSNEEEAVNLTNFYIAQAREEAEKDSLTLQWTSKNEPLIQETHIHEIFRQKLEDSRSRGLKGGVTPREFLNALHDYTRRVLQTLSE